MLVVVFVRGLNTVGRGSIVFLLWVVVRGVCVLIVVLGWCVDVMRWFMVMFVWWSSLVQWL